MSDKFERNYRYVISGEERQIIIRALNAYVANCPKTYENESESQIEKRKKISEDLIKQFGGY